MNASFHTLGCRLNQLETESLADAFRAAGFSVAANDDGADVIVVNTCTVTSMAEQKGRRMIRQAGRRGRGVPVIVTGCYAELEPERIADLGENVVVIPLTRKDSILDLATRLAEHRDHLTVADIVSDWKASLETAPPGAEKSRFRFAPGDFTFHSRASLKIQDGCDNECTYCRVRLARGKAHSLGSAEALSRAREIESAGFREIVLSGINLAQYRSEGTSFPDLLALLLEATQNVSFRISSWEPEAVDDAFLSIIKSDRVRPFFHLAIQSMSDPVLKAMKRRYSASRVKEAVSALRVAKPGAFFGADVIAGFPGETSIQADETLRALDDMDISWLHVFSFSARPGTEAFSMTPKVAESEISERTKALSALGERKRKAFAEASRGKRVKAIVERDGTLFTEHSLKLIPAEGQILPPPKDEITCALEVVFDKNRGHDDDCSGAALVF